MSVTAIREREEIDWRTRLYPKNAAALDLSLFRSPTSEYRGVPFWAWNTQLERQALLRQLEVFARMGFGGVHIHPRTGLATPYLGAEFMAHVRASAERAQELGLKVWLYDEDRWPSGFAGGLVTQDPALRARHLLFTPHAYDGQDAQPSLIAGAFPGRSGNGQLLARYAVTLETDRLTRFRVLENYEVALEGEQLWFAYLETALPSPWFNNQTYVDTLNPRAVRRFLEVTHERYREAVGELFGSTIPAMFTDEPQFAHKTCLEHPRALQDVVLPWTPDLTETYFARYGEHLLDRLPELFWELPDKCASETRYRYHDHIAERFASAYADQVGAWCADHGLMLTGHMMEEPTLHAQTSSLGDAMRSYRAFHLPGIDILRDAREYTTAKQAQSAARQFGRPGVSSELYGVTNWDFDFKGHKAQGDWQAALGVTVRVPHLAWASMAGEAKRDYPAPIGYQSPWHEHYPLVENHFARLNTVLTRGQAVVRVGVIHPVESYWLCFGPLEQTRLEREERERRFHDITDWLLFGLHDFDFIAESLLPELCPEHPDSPMRVGQARYDIIIVPSLRTLRSSTLERLERFADAGGHLVFIGELPSLENARPSARAARLAERCVRLEWSRTALSEALSDHWEVRAEYAPRKRLEEMCVAPLERIDALLCQLRQDGASRFAFLCNTDPLDPRSAVRLAFRGAWTVTLLDTLTGETHPVPSRLCGSETLLEWDFPAHGHALLCLDPRGLETALVTSPAPVWRELSRLHSPALVTLSEPNVLLLDRAEYRLDDGAWEPADELLRLDSALRSRLGWPLRMEALAQPWTQTPAVSTHHLTLCFTLHSDVALETSNIALEHADRAHLRLDGVPIPCRPNGWWVDESLQTVSLPAMTAGVHALEVKLPYSPDINIEWCYLLGDFGVRVAGAHAWITAPVRQLHFGDWTTQGLPFYAGNVTYHTTVESPGARLALHVPHFRASHLVARLGGAPEHPLAFAPHLADLGAVPPGSHSLALTAYGNRINAFGAVHLADERWRWFGPNAWRSHDGRWADEYQLRPTGVLVAPRVLTRP